MFVPEQFKGSIIESRKARILGCIHVFLLVLTIGFYFSNQATDGSGPLLGVAFFINLSLIITFKVYKNFTLSGNLLAFFFFLVQAEAVFRTGGLYSDNLLWMMASPLMAMLFANIKSGLLWFFGLISFTFFLYFAEVNSNVSFRTQTEVFDAKYFLVTYIGLFIIIVGLVLIFATGQKLIIQALNAKQGELAKQAEELAKQKETLQKAHVQLKAINQELEQFAYAASHDLKEPLRMIKMYTQFIDKKLKSQFDQSTQEYFWFVTDGVTRMERLLTDLLEYSRLGRGNRKVQDTDLNDVLFAVVNNLTATMQESNTAVRSNQLPVIQSTSTEMVQLFQNLISNSIKFRQKGLDPLIEIEHEIKQDKHHLKIKDNGIGIPKEACSRVFNIFERLHSKSEFEGTGIGLATCKKIIDNLGGKIWVEPGDKMGTVFQIEIPKA